PGPFLRRPGLARHAGQRHPAGPVHVHLPLVPILDGGPDRPVLESACRRPLAARHDDTEPGEPPARCLGLVQHVLRCADRCLHPALDGRHHSRTTGDLLSEAYETLTTDVLVIGAGGAGLRAAIEAAAAGARVDIVCKSLLGKAHTVMAEGGIAAALGNVDPEDNWQVHFQDTMRGGQMINNWRMAELHARESPDRVYELETYGAIFDRTPDGRVLQRAFGAHTYRRLCHVGDRTGLEMIRSLQDRIVQLGIDVHMEVTLTRLLKDGDRVVGAFGYNRVDGRVVAFRCTAIILASGRWGWILKVTSNSWEGTGDGVAMGFDAGAEVLDPGMVQFHPTGMVWPPGVRGILVTEAVRGEGGYLKNRDGKRFMLDYDPKKKELSSRDVVARSIYKEVEAGRGTEHGGANLDVTHL